MKRWRLDGWTGAVIAAAAACVVGTCGRAEAGLSGPSLIISDIAPSDPAPGLGDAIQIVVTVLNQGDVAATDAFDVDLYFDRLAKPLISDPVDRTLPATVPLAPQATTTVTLTGIQNSTAETWKTWAWVDRLDNVAEVKENDNLGGPVMIVWGGGATQPELSMTAIAPSASPATPTVPITVTVTVRNTGTADAISLRLDLFTNATTPPVIGEQSPDNLTGLSLAAGVTQDFDFTGIVSSVDTTWQMYAIVDTAEAIAEANENNNILGPENLVWGAGASLTVDAPNGLEVWDVGTVHNITWTSIGDVGNDVKIEYSPDGAASVWNEIVASTLNDGQYEWSVPDDPSTECIVRVISTTAAVEDVSDDVFTIQTPSVLYADLMILSITPSDANPTVPGPVDVTVTVLNQGDADADLFYVDLFTDRGIAPSVGESEGLRLPIDSLGAGLSTSAVFIGLTSADPVTWRMYAVVDTDGYIEEANADNNVEGPVLVGWGGGVDAIAVTSPNGAEVLEAGEVHRITWSVEGGLGPPYHIEYSIDGGASWGEVVGLTFNAASYDWTVPATPSTNSRALVSNALGTVSDVSDDVFEIHTTPELVILSVTPSDSHPIAEEEISVAVLVENRGTAEAEAFVVGLFQNAASKPAVGSPPDLSESVSSLAAAAQTTVTFESVTCGEAGVWSVYVAADNGTAVAEKDETNNVAGPASVEWHAQPWLGSGCAPGPAAPEASHGAARALSLVALASLLRMLRRRDVDVRGAPGRTVPHSFFPGARHGWPPNSAQSI